MYNINNLESLIGVLQGLDIDAIKSNLYKQYNLTEEQIKEVEKELEGKAEDFKAKRDETLNGLNDLTK
jgi:hypothetical protein